MVRCSTRGACRCSLQPMTTGHVAVPKHLNALPHSMYVHHRFNRNITCWGLPTPTRGDCTPKSTNNDQLGLSGIPQDSRDDDGTKDIDFDDSSSTRAAEIAADDVIVLLLAAAVGLSTGLAVVLFNTAVHAIQDEAVWRSIPRLAAFGTEGLQRGSTQAIGVWWQCLILPPVCGGAIVSLMRMLVGGFGGDPKSVAVEARPKKHKSMPATFVERIALKTSPSSTPQTASSSYVGVTPLTGSAISTAVPVVKIADVSSPTGVLRGARERIRGLVKDVRRKGLQATARPYVKLLAAAVTLGSGASLGPEGPSVDVGKANAARITCAARGQVCLPWPPSASGTSSCNPLCNILNSSVKFTVLTMRVVCRGRMF